MAFQKNLCHHSKVFIAAAAGLQKNSKNKKVLITLVIIYECSAKKSL
jgi:hypothetical protein